MHRQRNRYRQISALSALALLALLSGVAWANQAVASGEWLVASLGTSTSHSPLATRHPASAPASQVSADRRFGNGGQAPGGAGIGEPGI